MSDYKAPLEDILFVMNDVLNLQGLWRELDGLDDVDEDTANAVLEEAAKVSEQLLANLDVVGDEQGCVWQDGNVSAPEGYKEAYQTFCEGGWCGLAGNPEYEGMGMPKTLVAPIEEMIQGACMAFGLAPMLTAGACLAINSHASEELKQLYLPKMYSGEWSGAMDLTEPHCGTDLGLIRTKAEPQGDGSSYRISGSKIFITWGEHDMTENIVHLVLAKLPDAPSGTKGISLFLVPKFLPSNDGSIGERNSLVCGSIESKMGIKGSSTCVMNFDDAVGWLVGEPNKGLACMFTMMNYERLVVGIQGLGVAHASYLSAADYARERIQGRSPSGIQSPEKSADSLLVHPDVRRMLMTMRSLNEAGRVFYLYVAQFLDVAKYSTDPAKKAEAEERVNLLTPLTKGFITDMAFDVSVMGQQILGGHGYIREWRQEQRVRDIRITQIYEGTNGIQAMDLIGRKVLKSKGAILHSFTGEIELFLTSCSKTKDMEVYCTKMDHALALLKEVTGFLIENSSSDPNLPGASAVDYQYLLGYITYAYMWCKVLSSLEANERDDEFAQGKKVLADIYFEKVLPRIETHRCNILAGSTSLMGMGQGWF